jgi:hypothetical protein
LRLRTGLCSLYVKSATNAGCSPSRSPEVFSMSTTAEPDQI